MTRNAKWLTFAIVIVVLVVLFIAYRPSSFRFVPKPPSVHDRVTNVVEAWANMATTPGDKEELEVIWDTAGHGLDFYPHGAQDLTIRLQNEFRDSKTPVLEFTDIYAIQNPIGNIKTVAQLATAVAQKYRPKNN